MIKVLKHKSDAFRVTCPRCGCEYEYQVEDIETRLQPEDMTTQYFITTCPDCNNKCSHSPSSNGYDYSKTGVKLYG